MKSLIAIALLAASIGINKPSASAQSSGLQATVPFSFVSGSNHVAAGTYTFTTANGSRVLKIRNKANGTSVLMLAMPQESKKGDTAKLVFHRYGNQYFLTEIGGAASPINVHLLPSKEEKRARTEIEEAGLFPNDPIIIPLKLAGAE